MDCDAFYVQVARLEDPEGAGRAPLLIVGGASDRGVVTSASYETRAYGVRSAMPTARALKLCPEATVVPVPREACVARSRDVRAVLERLAPVVQAASIDEFYLDLSGTERLFGGESLKETAERIRRTVLEETRISVSIGGGTRRLIAKLASRPAKPAGVYVVPAGEEEAFLRTLELRDIPGVGPALLGELREKGIRTVEDALDLQLEWLRRWLGPRRGAWLYRRIRGLDDSEVDPREVRKSISSERTFSRDIGNDSELERRLQRLAVSVAGTLRSKGSRARTISVKVRERDFTTHQRSRTLPHAVESDAAIWKTARALFRELREHHREALRLVGVGVSGLEGADSSEQLPLFTDGGPEKGEGKRDRTVSQVVDELRAKFGKDALMPGSTLHTGRTGTPGGSSGGSS